ncbi:MAG: acyl-CoA dehydratase activase [Dehalococcoidia bacterium]
MGYSLGLDIGSVNAKAILIDEEANIVYQDRERIVTTPRTTVISLLTRLSHQFNLDDIVSAGVSGAGGDTIPKAFNHSQYSSPLAIIFGLLQSHPDAKTIVQIGGQNSFVIELEDGLRKPWRVQTNPLCAAGTGRFIEQQAYRLDISLEDFSRLALQAQGKPPRIAGRCSVFAKTDLIHLQQKGVSIESMLRALSNSVAHMVCSFKKGKFEEPIYFTGGVAEGPVVRESLKEAISGRNRAETQVFVPDHCEYIQPLGTALLAQKSGKQARMTIPEHEDAMQRYLTMPKLGEVSQGEYTWKPHKIERPITGYLGVDVGSTSTKAVILDESGTEIVAKHYLMTEGRPLEAVKKLFPHLIEWGAENVNIAGVGVTGSGRYLIGSFVGADVVRNEITAQTRAAEDLDREADIIEVGGQDSKLVIKRNEVVVDYQMNKACAAGTGSFIDEMAELLDVSVKNGQYADLAFQAPYMIDLGSRCASFMGQAVASAQQQGILTDVIAASLCSSIARNYISQILEGRKLGEKVILTGALFFNAGVISAFQRELGDRQVIVPEHREVTGAIGAALLARDRTSDGASKFKGFHEVIEQEYKLKTFTCKKCENYCTITQLKLPDGPPTFYGSRCDLFDSIGGASSREKKQTAFDERERLLFNGYQKHSGSGPTVGIPRALLIYDYAPLLIGFLNSLGARIVLSDRTSPQIIDRAVELSYSDLCFPMKLIYAHADSLKEEDTDYILFPSCIRMGLKEGEENQKYTCPLNQAAPFIIRENLHLNSKMLIPFVDFSNGDEDVIDNLTRVAREMGFSKNQGKTAAEVGINSLREFERARQERGQELLRYIHQTNQIGVVIISRAYMFQDPGANQNIANELAKLGVVPIPLDYLPLHSVDPKKYSDRPYWIYESKFFQAADIIHSDPQLYGLVLTNFGCGPNSFILPVVHDIMGSKPLTELEVDEHAAEAGVITRLEAFVDTITGFYNAKNAVTEVSKDIYRGAPTVGHSKGTLLVPRMAPHADVLTAAFRAFGINAMTLPPSDEKSLLYSDKLSTGKECLPFRVTIGDFLKFYYENGHHGVNFNDVEAFMAGAYGACRFGKYAPEQARVLKDVGFDIPILTSVSNDGYRDTGLGAGFERLAWKGIVAMDYLQKLLWQTRPYEKSEGSADELFKELGNKVAERVQAKQDLYDIVQRAGPEFNDLIDPTKPKRPLVGINGEIFLRSNEFSNQNLVKNCEAAGLEVMVSPISEWFYYISLRNVEDGVQDRKVRKTIHAYIKQKIQEQDAKSVTKYVNPFVNVEDSTIKELYHFTKPYLSPKCGSEAVLTVGSGVEWLENPAFSGVISVMPHGCMPGGIGSALADSLSARYGKPWTTLTYDGSPESNNLTRINNFAEMLRFSGEQ